MLPDTFTTMIRTTLFILLGLIGWSVTALDPSCYSTRLGMASENLFACTADPDDVRALDRCTLLCAACTTPATRFAMVFNDIATDGRAVPICDDPSYTYDAEQALDVATEALLASAASHGFYWLDDGGSESNAMECVRFLLGTMRELGGIGQGS